jgi:protein-S-isoprenylcysteine O-methyltransferase Ste14
MDLYGKKDKSIPQKVSMTVMELFIIGISYWVLFSGGYHRIFPSSTDYGKLWRHIVLFAFNLVVFARICVTFFYLVKRYIPWSEAFNIPFAFALYYVGFALLSYQTAASVSLVDVLAILLFIVGSYLNTVSEILRNRWKKRQENEGHLYTGGLFTYAMHINYFGDFIWVTAYAIFTHNRYAFTIPFFLFCFFVFYNIPKLDRYLAGRYGQQFESYKRRTKKFIPFIY